MHLNREISKVKALFIGIALNLFLWGVWFVGVSSVYNNYIDIKNGASLININVVGLWIPIGLFGVCVVFLIQTLVSVITGVKARFVIGDALGAFFDRFMLFFAVLGLVGGISIYKLMTERLDDLGYSYCKPLSRFSAMGRHEVYVSSNELCIKPTMRS